MLEPPPKYDSCILKYLDVVVEVDFDLTVSEFQPSDLKECSMSLCTSIINNGLIYVE
jgi:hypothetical protein